MGNSPTSMPHVRVTRNTDTFAVVTNCCEIVKLIPNELLESGLCNVNYRFTFVSHPKALACCLAFIDGTKITIATVPRMSCIARTKIFQLTVASAMTSKFKLKLLFTRTNGNQLICLYSNLLFISSNLKMIYGIFLNISQKSDFKCFLFL